MASLAAATNVSRATVKARIDRLVENGTIEAFTIRLGAELRQAAVRAIVLIEVEGKAADHVAQRLRGVPEVRALYAPTAAGISSPSSRTATSPRSTRRCGACG